jgi:ElaB/YqjD/DUF883 family membrane-anchored ribosome-binding protein
MAREAASGGLFGDSRHGNFMPNPPLERSMHMPSKTTEAPSGGAVAEVKGKGAELASTTQEQISTKAHELGEEAGFQVREQLAQRSTQAGEQVQAIGSALQSGVEQLRNDGKDVPAKMVAEVARRADDVGGYLKAAQADEIIADLESFARRRPWVTAGAGLLAGFVASRFVKASADRRYAEQRANVGGNGYQSRRSLPAGSA